MRICRYHHRTPAAPELSVRPPRLPRHPTCQGVLMSDKRPVDKLTLPQRRALKETVAAWRAKGHAVTAGEVDILVRQMLGELDAVQTRMEMFSTADPHDGEPNR